MGSMIRLRWQNALTSKQLCHISAMEQEYDNNELTSLLTSVFACMSEWEKVVCVFVCMCAHTRACACTSETQGHACRVPERPPVSGGLSHSRLVSVASLCFCVAKVAFTGLWLRYREIIESVEIHLTITKQKLH